MAAVAPHIAAWIREFRETGQVPGPLAATPEQAERMKAAAEEKRERRRKQQRDYARRRKAAAHG